MARPLLDKGLDVRTTHRFGLVATLAMSGAAQAAVVSQDAIDGCIDALRVQCGAGGGGWSPFRGELAGEAAGWQRHGMALPRLQ